MNCLEVEELVPAYLLGALDEREQALVEAHIRECPTCLALFHEQSPSTAFLSTVGDSLQAPPALKQRVLEMVGTSASPNMRRGAANGIFRFRFIRNSLRQPLAATAMALMTISLLGLSVGSLLLWLDVRDLKNQDSRISATLQEQLDQMQDENQRLSQLLFDQLDLAYVASMPGVSTIMLEGAEAAPKSRGMLMISPHATGAILEALNLQPLPKDKAYQLWLIADGIRASGGIFTVNETGYGQLMVQDIGHITDFQTMGVSIEPAQGSPWPTGVKVMGGVITTAAFP
ncbi:MAG: anti-sigma factor [Chloroflexi bacterium]|nr:anti-sigma factor [Chloroflexota bacterium]